MKKYPVQKIKGIICTNWAKDFWQFQLVSRQRWDYNRTEHALSCCGSTVAVGVMCLGDAVLFAQGYESGVADLTRAITKRVTELGGSLPDGEEKARVMDLIRRLLS